MTTSDFIKKAIRQLDEYMIRTGKDEINEMEANRELANAGILNDETEPVSYTHLTLPTN